MNINDIKSVYFVGAGGIGMSAIARYFLKKGLVVGGYDKTPSDLTRQLEKEGMFIHYEEDINQIPQACKNKQECLVIYTPAIPAEHKELCYFQENGFEIQKRAQVLGTLTKTHKGLCVAGTHGKTTTSTMCAHIMHQSHLDCNAFLGGISKNYGTNYILSDSDYVVIEADEFDRSFHWLRPWMSVITSTDPDHLDIYGTKDAYLESFRHYSELIQPGGALIIHRNLEMKEHLQDGVAVELVVGVAFGEDLEYENVRGDAADDADQRKSRQYLENFYRKGSRGRFRLFSFCVCHKNHQKGPAGCAESVYMLEFSIFCCRPLEKKAKIK